MKKDSGILFLELGLSMDNNDADILEPVRRLKEKGALYPSTAVIVIQEETNHKKYLIEKLKLTICSPQ